MYRRPKTVIMIAFATGSTTIQSNLEATEVRAALNVPYYETRVVKDARGMEISTQEPTQVTLKSISETKVKEDPRAEIVQYILKDEEVVFARKDVVFWSLSVANDPPKIEIVGGGIARI
jgi:hypothetical protein